MTIGDVVSAVMNGNVGYLLGMVLTLLWTISASARRGFASIKRLGRRIGKAEQAAVLLDERVAVLEQLLRDEGLPVPRRAAPVADYDDEEDEEPDDFPATRVPIPSIPPLPQALRRSER